MPREGLERDYLPEDTLYDVVRWGRRRRGFEVEGRCRMWDDGVNWRDERLTVVTKIIFD